MRSGWSRRSVQSESCSSERRRWRSRRRTPTPIPSCPRRLTAPQVSFTTPPRPFGCVDQQGAPVSLTSLRGKVIVLAFLDPVCVSDCPIIAQELKATDEMLGADARNVELVAVVINPVYRSTAYLDAFDHQEGLDQLANWDFLTGTPAQLHQVWNRFGVLVAYSTGGSMIAHSDSAFVIDASGDARYILNTDPGPGSQATRSSTSVVLTNAVESVLPG